MPTDDSKPLFRTGNHAVFMGSRSRVGEPANTRHLEVLVESRDRDNRPFWEVEYDRDQAASVLEEMALSLTPQSPSSMAAVLTAARALVLATSPRIVPSGAHYSTALDVLRSDDKHDAHSLHKALREALGISRGEWEAARDGQPWPGCPRPTPEQGAAAYRHGDALHAAIYGKPALGASAPAPSDLPDAGRELPVAPEGGIPRRIVVVPHGSPEGGWDRWLVCPANEADEPQRNPDGSPVGLGLILLLSLKTTLGEKVATAMLSRYNAVENGTTG